MKLISCFSSALICLAGLSVTVHAAVSQKPNILFILADDYGVGEVGCYGADRYRTPNIDALAKGGTRFTNAYTISLCGPSRAQILTGRYPFRTGATNQDATGTYSPAQWTMLPAVLKAAGYTSSAIGKWGQLPLGPAEFGFDDYFKFQGSGSYWKSQGVKGENVEINGKKVPVGDKDYIPDLMHNHLVRFLEKNRERPFFLYYSLSHVHTEILPTPESKPGADDAQIYADNVTYMDKLVGKCLAELERLKLRENTLIVFLGDNGTATGRADAATIGGRRLSGQKGTMLEGGGLVPMIVNWPGITPAAKVSHDLVDSSDLLPTFAELAGAPLPARTIIDGHSFAPQIRGQAGTPRAWIFNQLARMWYVRDAGWKLNEKGELFDMSGAPFEEKPVPADSRNPAAIAARQRLAAVLAQLNPAGGILDHGDGSGRHAKNVEREKKKKK